MRHRKFTFKIGRSSAHVRSLLANAVCSLIKHRRITTTLVKARRISVLADQMLTLGKTGTLHARKQAIAKLKQPATVAILFDEIAPLFKERRGGYTRIYKLGPRRGDAAEMALLEFVESDEMLRSREQAEDSTAKAAPESSEKPVEAAAETVSSETEAVLTETSAEDSAEAVSETVEVSEAVLSEADSEPAVAAEDDPVAEEAPEA